MKHHISFIIVFLFLSTAIACPAYSDNYWVDNNGSATWSDCKGEFPKQDSEACSLSTANANAAAGDVINMRGGDYSTYVNPSNDGESGNPIIFQEYNDENPRIYEATYGFKLDNSKYITIDGVNVENVSQFWVDLRNGTEAHDLIIKNCTFIQADGFGGIHASGTPNMYNIQLVNNTIIGRCIGGSCSSKGYGGPSDGIYFRDVTRSVIYGNTITHAAHNLINLRTSGCQWIVVKDNYLENKWHGAIDAHRSTQHHLIEGNTVYNSSYDIENNFCWDEPSDCGPASDRIRERGVKGQTWYSIYRRNIIISNGYGLKLSATPSKWPYKNRIYHNTLYDNWINLWVTEYGDGPGVDDNIIKNNTFSSPDTSVPGYRNVDWKLDSGGAGNKISDNNFYDGPIYYGVSRTIAWLEENEPSEWANNLTVDPKFIDSANEIFTLQPDSSLIDAASHLTESNGSGSSSTFMPVEDSLYFFTTGSPWNVPDDYIDDDTIYVDNPTSPDFITTVSAINYETNTLTLASPQTWDDNAKIYHCPDGTCFSGSAPDIGAYEYGVDSLLFR